MKQLEAIIFQAIKNLRNKGKLDGITLSRSHRRDLGINISQINEQELSTHVSKITDMVYFHGIEPAKESWHEINGLIRPIFNAAIIELCKFLPYLPGIDKNNLYRLIGIKIGENTTIAPRVQFDYFHPELIEIGDYCLIGDNAKIWTHEYGIDYFMLGPVKICNKVKISSQATIGPATIIEDNAKINFGAFLYGTRIPERSIVLGQERSDSQK